MRFTIVKPSVWMYLTEDLCGEVSDQLLFGTDIEILSENDTCVYCRTDYGYCGYINKWELCQCETDDCRAGEKKTVYHRCDILTEPEYGKAPYMSLSKGARIIVGERYNEKFTECYIGKKRLYISNHVFVNRSSGDFRKDMIKTAMTYIGTPYRWGGKSDDGVDCSGLVFMCASLCGKSVYRDAIPKSEYVEAIDEKEIKQGDLIYFKGHVAIYAGGDEIIHSSARYGRVIRQSFSQSGLSKRDVVCYASVK